VIAQQEEFYSTTPGASPTAPILTAAGCCNAEPYGPFVPYHEEDGAFVLCWDCHGYLVGPPGSRLCRCEEPGPVSPTEEARFLAIEALRDALAEAYRRRWFRVLMPLLEGAIEDESRAAWDGLRCAACKRAARRLAERKLA